MSPPVRRMKRKRDVVHQDRHQLGMEAPALTGEALAGNHEGQAEGSRAVDFEMANWSSLRALQVPSQGCCMAIRQPER